MKFTYLRKAILFLESEIDLLKLIFLQANRFSFNNQSPTHKVYFVPKPKEGLGVDSMGEFATTFELSDQFVDEEGKPAPFIHIAHSLENAFNFSFGDAYKSKSRVFSRKPYNLTKALDYLKALIIKASRKTK